MAHQQEQCKLVAQTYAEDALNLLKGTFALDAPADFELGSGSSFIEASESLGKTASNRFLCKLVIPVRGGIATRPAPVRRSTHLRNFPFHAAADPFPTC